MKLSQLLPVLFFGAGTIALGCAALEAGAVGGSGGDATGGGQGANGGGGGHGGHNGPNKDNSNGGSGGTELGTGGAGGANPATQSGGGAGSPGSGGSGGASDIQCMDPGTPQVLYMSSDDSSSMGSPALAREYLNAGLAPPQDQIRIYEFLNYYRVRYPISPTATSLDVHAHFAPAKSGGYRLQIGVQGFDVVRPPMALTFVLDTSGSLVGEGMAREREAVRAIAHQLAAGDHVNFVTWANDGEVLLNDQVMTGPDDPALLKAIDQLAPGGGSDLHAGLVHGYQKAALTKAPDRLSRVVLISDGGANIGVLDKNVIAQAAKDGDSEGIYLVGIGIGPAQAYSDDLMNTVTDQGRGAYVYLDTVEEADAILGERFDEVMDIAARAVQVQVTLPSYFVFQEFYGEGKSENADEVPPQHLAPKDSMIFDQVLGLSAGSKLCDQDHVTVQTTWQSPLLHPGVGGNMAVWTKPLQELQGEPWQLHKAEAIVLYAKALSTRKKADFDAASEALDAAIKDPTIGDDPFKTELDDISDLLQKFPQAEIHDGP